MPNFQTFLMWHHPTSKFYFSLFFNICIERKNSVSIYMYFNAWETAYDIVGTEILILSCPSMYEWLGLQSSMRHEHFLPQEVRQLSRWERCKLYYHQISAVSEVAKVAVGIVAPIFICKSQARLHNLPTQPYPYVSIPFGPHFLHYFSSHAKRFFFVPFIKLSQSKLPESVQILAFPRCPFILLF